MSEEDDYSLEFSERVFFDRNQPKTATGGAGSGGGNAMPNRSNAGGGNGPKTNAPKSNAPAAGGDLNTLVMRSLQKLLNLGGLAGGNAVGQRLRVAANGNGVRRTNANVGAGVRRQGTANNVIQKRRYQNQNGGNGQANGNMRNNRRF